MSVLKLPARIPACIYMGEFENSDQLSYRVEVLLTWNDSCRIGGRSCQPSVPRTPQSVLPCGIHSDVMGESVTMATQDHKLCVCVCVHKVRLISLYLFTFGSSNVVFLEGEPKSKAFGLTQELP